MRHPFLIIIFVLDLENFICYLDYFTNVYNKLKFTRISGKTGYFKCKFKFIKNTFDTSHN